MPHMCIQCAATNIPLSLRQAMIQEHQELPIYMSIIVLDLSCYESNLPFLKLNLYYNIHSAECKARS